MSNQEDKPGFWDHAKQSLNWKDFKKGARDVWKRTSTSWNGTTPWLDDPQYDEKRIMFVDPIIESLPLLTSSLDTARGSLSPKEHFETVKHGLVNAGQCVGGTLASGTAVIVLPPSGVGGLAAASATSAFLVCSLVTIPAVGLHAVAGTVKAGINFIDDFKFPSFELGW